MFTDTAEPLKNIRNIGTRHLYFIWRLSSLWKVRTYLECPLSEVLLCTHTSHFTKKLAAFNAGGDQFVILVISPETSITIIGS